LLLVQQMKKIATAVKSDDRKVEMDFIKIDNDKWDDFNKVWALLEYNRRPNSTAVSLVLEDTETKEIVHKTVAFHQIEWLEEAKDW
jgi:hypothetical protein